MHKWRDVRSGIECDESAGEIYLRSSSGKVSSLEQCKSLCESMPACQSITYFANGWCSHYSTLCSKTRRNKKAVVRSLCRNANFATTTHQTTTTHPPTPIAKTTTGPATNTAATWHGVILNAACDTKSGEMYLESSWGEVPCLKQCKNSCESAAGCQSITYFASGWCSHYGTPCTNIKWQNGAMAASIFWTSAVAEAKTSTTATTLARETMRKRGGNAT